MQTGTCHFPSFAAALSYYTPYHYADTMEAVRRKIAEGEIVIGPPILRPGQRVFLSATENRYFIEE